MLALTPTGGDNWDTFQYLSMKYDRMLVNGTPIEATDRKHIADLFYDYLIDNYQQYE